MYSFQRERKRADPHRYSQEDISLEHRSFAIWGEPTNEFFPTFIQLLSKIREFINCIYRKNHTSTLACFTLNLLLLGSTLFDHSSVSILRQSSVLVQQTIVELLVIIHTAVTKLTIFIRLGRFSYNLMISTTPTLLKYLISTTKNSTTLMPTNIILHNT